MYGMLVGWCVIRYIHIYTHSHTHIYTTLHSDSDYAISVPVPQATSTTNPPRPKGMTLVLSHSMPSQEIEETGLDLPPLELQTRIKDIAPGHTRLATCVCAYKYVCMYACMCLHLSCRRVLRILPLGIRG